MLQGQVPLEAIVLPQVKECLGHELPQLGAHVSGHLLRLLPAQPGQVLDQHGVHHGLLRSCNLAEQLLIVLHDMHCTALRSWPAS